MDKHLIIIGWGSSAERVIFETYQRREAIEAHQECHADWMESWSEDIESEGAWLERPSHVVDCGDEGYLEYFRY